MRIAMLHWAFPPTIGGVETHLFMVCPALARRGHQVGVLTGAINGETQEELWQGVYLRRTPLLDLNSLTPALIEEKRAAIAEEMNRFFTTFKPDLVHAHNMHYFSPVHTEILMEFKKRYGFPVILTAHNVWEDELFKEMLRFRHDWDGIIAVSHFIKREMVAAGYPAEKIVVIHHGLAYRHFLARTENPEIRRVIREAAGDKKIIFHPARMSLAKGSDVVVKAFRRVKETCPSTFLLLAGTDKTVDWGAVQQKEIAQIKELIHYLGLEKDILIRFFSWEEIPAAYRESDIVVYPSAFQEPFGIALLEAMALGKPLVVTRVGGMPEIVLDGETGFVVPPRDPEALADKLIFLLQHPEKAQELGEKALKRFKEKFSLEEMLKAMTNYYHLIWRRSTREKGAPSYSAAGR
ncbi:glycosyltransferase family 4 protein [Ammonifex thiophilus]|uniref:Glycosyltransferase family 1 protein n=1 Tax=Ammonifex thiophilus TaxID=444093 RepID=A0A3D8P3H2_9THEO|nr:glycosyltransferase family 4 protein [Ammonifex thiophilus]RDV83408.1 glycosyltransferase family 1 protein [Ammonifex thiophilus]